MFVQLGCRKWIQVNHVTSLSSVLICFHLYIEEEKSPFVIIIHIIYIYISKTITTKRILVVCFNPSDKHISPIISLHICIFHKDLWIKHYHLSLNFSQISVQTSSASIFSPMFPCGVKNVGEMLAFIMLPWNLSCLIMSVASIPFEKTEGHFKSEKAYQNHQHFHLPHLGFLNKLPGSELPTDFVSIIRPLATQHRPATHRWSGRPQRMMAPNSPIASEASAGCFWANHPNLDLLVPPTQ